MAFHSRIPISANAAAGRSLHKIRSEGCLNDSSACQLRRLRSMGQLSPPPDEPLPPLPRRSPLRPSNQTNRVDNGFISSDRITQMRLLAISDSISCSSNNSEEPISNRVRSPPRKKVLIHEQKDQEIEFRTHNKSGEASNLQDLGRLLELCNRLKDMGASFTKQGEMQAYGNPLLDTELEQMLCLGAEYDALWNAFFTGWSPDVGHNLWPVVRVLKKMLQNEGVAIDDHHIRLDFGSGTPKHIRLSHRYDELRQEWFDKTLSNVHPAERWDQTPAQMAVPDTPIIKGSSLTQEKCLKGRSASESRRIRCLTRIAEEQPDVHDEPCSTVPGADKAYSSPPKAPDTLVDAHSRASASTYSASIKHLYEWTADTPMMHHSIPLQGTDTVNSFETHNVSMTSGANSGLHYPAPGKHEHSGVLGCLVEDERRYMEAKLLHAEHQFAGMIVADAEQKNSSTEKGSKRKIIKKWLRATLNTRENGGK